MPDPDSIVEWLVLPYCVWREVKARTITYPASTQGVCTVQVFIGRSHVSGCFLESSIAVRETKQKSFAGKGRPNAGWWFRWQRETGDQQASRKDDKSVLGGTEGFMEQAGSSAQLPALCGSIPLRAFRGREIYWVPLRGRLQSEGRASNEPMQNNPCTPCTKMLDMNRRR